MRFSTKTRYAIRAMIEIGQADSTKGILQKDIAQNQHLSNKYLDQIILGLKAAELIRNVKGKGSGYMLTRNPSEITALDIHNAFEPGICVIDCIEKSFNCPRTNICKTKNFWTELNQLIINHFKSKTLCDLINEEVKKEK